MTKVKHGKEEGGLNGDRDGEFYVFAVPEGSAAPLLEHVIYKAANERTARGLCVLFAKRPPSAPGGMSFRHQPVLSFAMEEQIVMDEVLEWLDCYGHPDPTVYAVRPSAEVLWRAQCAARARKWDRRLQEKVQAQGLWLGAVVEDARVAGRALGEEEKVNEALRVLVTFAAAAQSRAPGPAPQPANVPASEGGKAAIRRVGRLSYRQDFKDVWVGDQHFDLRERTKARLCIRYLVEHGAFEAASARHLVEEIDPYVRQHGNFLPAADIRIHHYFNDRNGPLTELRKALVVPAGRLGRFYLKVG